MFTFALWIFLSFKNKKAKTKQKFGFVLSRYADLHILEFENDDKYDKIESKTTLIHSM